MRRLRLALLLFLAAGPAAAQLTITADASRTDVSIDEQISLAVTVSGPNASLPEPRMPALQNLSIYNAGNSQTLSIVNGSVSSSIVYTYVVSPRAVGKTVIPPISVEYKGQVFKTEPIEINVRKPDSGMPGAPGMPQRAARQSARSAGQEPEPAAARRGSPEMFVTAELDKKRAVVNEQVTLTVRFYTAASLMQSPQYQPPALTGFLAEDLPPERHGTTSSRGRTYYYSEIRTALFPAHDGRLTVGPAAVRAVLPPTAVDDPFSADFFQRMMQGGAGGRPVELASDPIVLGVEPLPAAGKPAGFGGAVGRFTIAAAVDRPKVKAGEAVNLTVTVAGEGNLKAIGDPAMPETPQLRAFDTVSSLNIDKKNDVVRGSKVFKTVLVPRVSGKVTIPPIRFDYFDPAKRAYQTAASQPIELDAAPGDAGASAAAAGPAAPSPRGVTEVSQDLRYLKAAPRRGAATRALEALAAAGPLHALPFFLFAGALGLTQYRRLASADPAGARARGALRAAQAKLKQAGAAADPGAAAALLSDALTGYLADKLGQPASGLTARRAIELSRARNPRAPAALLDRVKEAWDELDMRRFAPSSSGEGGDAAAARLGELLESLDREVFG